MSELNLCKNEGKEMASVLFSNIEGGMCSLIIDEEEFIEEEGRAVIPKAVLKQLQIEENCKQNICEPFSCFYSRYKRFRSWLPMHQVDKGVDLMAKLMKILLAEKRYSDAERASDDSEYRDQLLKEYKLVG